MLGCVLERAVDARNVQLNVTWEVLYFQGAFTASKVDLANE